jgi:hypothetical protein
LPNDLLKLVLTDWIAGQWYNRHALRAGFIAHNEHIRSVVQKENLLEFSPDQGWGPLGEFLGKGVPDEQYPKISKGFNAANIHKPIMYIRYATVLVKAMVWPVAIGSLAWGWMKYGPRSRIW